ncbi:MAG TPA: hypothetical protein VFM05_08740 [Candidatus Saccharimonadales bacterium]|nr:hypothetical protein [Candidatus Saccharimonadales bacterium]
MLGIIEIKDKHNGFLTVELRDLLPLIEPVGRDLIWSILDLDAMGDPNKLKRNLLEIEEYGRQSPQGYILSWDDLVDLAESLIDIMDAVIVGCRNRSMIPKLEPSSDIYSSCEIVIEAIDSAIWRIHSKHDEFVERLKTSFHDVVESSIHPDQNVEF